MTQANSTALKDTSWQQLVNVAYWRFFVNAALTVCDMAAFVLASVIVLMARNEAALYSARFHFHINLAVYVVVCALIWALCMHSVGVYHRHVMGDGYQLNLLLFKGTVLAGIMVCAVDFILNSYVSLLSTALIMVCALLITMAERFVIRRLVLFSREKGAYSYATVVVGSCEGIEHALRFLSQKQQLNYRTVAVCPIGLNAQTEHIEAASAPEEFMQEIRRIGGKEIPVLAYGGDLAERAVAMGAQTVMVTDVLQRFSDNFNTFALSLESMNLEIALVTSAADASDHETNVRVDSGHYGDDHLPAAVFAGCDAAEARVRRCGLAARIGGYGHHHCSGGHCHQADRWRADLLHADPCGAPRQAVQDDQVPFHGGECRQDEG